jgi:2-polyprenyl-3-methyl-5-hydroxy-6-metoxy-1,4-benzoquinol methylase
MANAFDSLGRTAEAVESYQRALTINPDYAEVHFNLGTLAIARGDHDEAIRSLRRAVEIKSDFAHAHRTLAVELSRLGEFDEAESSCRRALSIEPQSEGTLCELAMILRASNKAPEALPLLMPSLVGAPTWATKVAFASCVSRSAFAVDDPKIRAVLRTAITEPWGIPSQLTRPALSLVMLDRRIAVCIGAANTFWPVRLEKAALFGTDGLGALGEDYLLHAVLQTAPVNTIEFERFLTCARRCLLDTGSGKHASDPSDIAALRFYAALSQQCFLNEYIFECDERQGLAAASCSTRLLGLLDANQVVPPLLLLAVAAYSPLHSIRGAERLLEGSHPEPIDAVLRQQILEPIEEQRLRASIKRLTPITVGVSDKVRNQYEKNPYPRWVKLQKKESPLNFNSELRSALPFGSFTPMRDDRAPEALIAGCGTGSHSIFTAQRFRGIRVLAIDLSLSSIAYAKRKAQEMSIANIEFGQADILKLGEIGRTFDIIQSAGVLHHMADPFMGWRTLLSLLRSGGFMFLGFYSELGRRRVAKAREIIAARGYSSAVEDIRRFRQDVIVGHLGIELQSLSQAQDFFSISECRDLFFHVQEHRLTLSQIESFLTDLGLHFIGFELDRSVLHQYRTRFTDDPTCSDLRNWAAFEADNPETFSGMYQFWIQKPP